jgi:hypothetical protein
MQSLGKQIEGCCTLVGHRQVRVILKCMGMARWSFSFPDIPHGLPCLANPEHKSQRFWPLHTNSAAANEKAVQALTPAQSQLLASGQASLAGVLATFGGR